MTNSNDGILSHRGSKINKQALKGRNKIIMGNLGIKYREALRYRAFLKKYKDTYGINIPPFQGFFLFRWIKIHRYYILSFQDILFFAGFHPFEVWSNAIRAGTEET